MVNKISIVRRRVWPFFVLLLCLFVSRNFTAQEQLTLLPDAPKPEPGTIVDTVVDITTMPFEAPPSSSKAPLSRVRV